MALSLPGPALVTQMPDGKRDAAGWSSYCLAMSESVYNVIELIGTSAESWEKATANAVAEAAKTIEDLRVARVIEQDVTVEEGQVVLFRSKVRLSFKHESD